MKNEMIENAEDDEILEEIRKGDDKEDFKSILNKKKVSKWEMDEALIGETGEV
ncbi:hypothetical protein JW756_05255 [Candidatus Woesearchaeota archaeon]|nr:hypothetical protein [Candidatus Woesearchaeota archaeon]